VKNTSVTDVQVVSLPKIHAESGNITAINSSCEVNFIIKRCYYLYDVPGGTARGGHAHKELHQLIVAASGSFDVVIDDSENRKTIRLNQPHKGIYLPPGLWRELDNFSAGSICLVLASAKYDEKDYIRDYPKFIAYKQA